MTATLDHTLTHPQASAEPDLPVPLPTDDELIAATIGEATAAGIWCDEYTARRIIGIFTNAREVIDRPARDVYHLSTLDLEVHEVLEVVVPGNQKVPPAGSAHELYNRRFCREGELGLVHCMDIEDEIEYCSVSIERV